MLEQALEAEVEAYIDRHRETRDVGGRALVVRNGRAQARSVVVGAGVLEVRTPRVNDTMATADPPHHVGDDRRTTDPCAAAVTMLVGDAGERARDRRRALPLPARAAR